VTCQINPRPRAPANHGQSRAAPQNAGCAGAPDNLARIPRHALGYPRCAPPHNAGTAERPLAAADVYQALREPRPLRLRDVAAEWHVRATGRVLVMRDGVHCFRLREGRVVEWHGFEDTALTCEALGL